MLTDRRSIAATSLFGHPYRIAFNGRFFLLEKWSENTVWRWPVF